MKNVQWGTRIATLFDFDVYVCNMKDLARFTRPWAHARSIDVEKSKAIADSYSHLLQTTVDGAICVAYTEEDGFIVFDGNHRVHAYRHFITHDMNALVHVYKFTHKNELIHKYRVLNETGSGCSQTAL